MWRASTCPINWNPEISWFCRSHKKYQVCELASAVGLDSWRCFLEFNAAACYFTQLSLAKLFFSNNLIKASEEYPILRNLRSIYTSDKASLIALQNFFVKFLFKLSKDVAIYITSFALIQRLCCALQLCLDLNKTTNTTDCFRWACKGTFICVWVKPLR